MKEIGNGIYIRAILNSVMTTNPVTSFYSTFLNSIHNDYKWIENEQVIDDLEQRIQELEQFKSEIITLVEKHFEQTSCSIIFPNPNITWNLKSILETKGTDRELKSLYANLFTNLMNAETAQLVHPAFINIINQLSVDEIIILRLFPPSLCRAYPIVDVIDSSHDGRNYLLKNYTDLGIDEH